MVPVLTVSPINDKAIWEDFISKRPEANFLQSWNFGVFHQALGKEIFRLGLFEEQQLVGVALVVREKAKRGTYLAIAGGPIIDWTKKAHLEAFFAALRKLGEEQQCLFIRIRPQVEETQEIQALVKQLGLVLSPMHLTADLTLQLDLTQTEEALLAQMRKNTRYEVRRAAKEEIVVQQSTNPADIQAFYDQQVAVAKKHKFVPFSYNFLYQQFLAMQQDGNVVLFHAYQQNKLLASAFVIFYNKEAVYHYGVSTADNQRLPGSYACQWAAIQEAKNRGCLKYNFWGIAPEDKPDHRFAGVSLFKRGFGGREVQYLPAHDLPLHWAYQLTRQFELLRKKLRKL